MSKKEENALPAKEVKRPSPPPRPPGRSDNTTVRDQFAMAALQGMLANRLYEPPRRLKADGFAEDAYTFADAMLKARGTQP